MEALLQTMLCITLDREEFQLFITLWRSCRHLSEPHTVMAAKIAIRRTLIVQSQGVHPPTHQHPPAPPSRWLWAARVAYRVLHPTLVITRGPNPYTSVLQCCGNCLPGASLRPEPHRLPPGDRNHGGAVSLCHTSPRVRVTVCVVPNASVPPLIARCPT